MRKGRGINSINNVVKLYSLALNTNKEGVLDLARKGHKVEKPEDLLKDPFVLEFLNIEQNYRYLESELEDKIISILIGDRQRVCIHWSAVPHEFGRTTFLR